MKALSLSLGLSVVLMGGLAACAPQATQMVDSHADHSAYGMGLDSRDFEKATQELTEKMLDSGAVDHPGGGRYVVSVKRVENETMQQFDTDLVVEQITSALLESGKAVVSKVSFDTPNSTDPVIAMHKYRNSSEVNHAGLSQPGEMMPAELQLTGKVIQLNSTVDSGQRVLYAFQLSLEDLRTGLVVWQNHSNFSKLGTARTVAW